MDFSAQRSQRCVWVLLYVICGKNFLLKPAVALKIYAVNSSGVRFGGHTVVVEFNSFVTLVCTGSGADKPILWEHKHAAHEVFYQVEPSEFVSVERKSEQELRLALTKTRFATAGKYRCTSKFFKTSVTLQVLNGNLKFKIAFRKAIGSLGIHAQTQQKVVYVGKFQLIVHNLNLEAEPGLLCKFGIGSHTMNDINVVWTGGLYATNPELYTRTLFIGNDGNLISTLMLRRTSTDIRLYGNYKCDLVVEGTKTNGFDILLKIPPVIPNPMQLVYLTYGENFSYTCNVIAYPPVDITITWAKDLNRINESNKRIVFGTEKITNDRITIKAITLEDFGVYSCFAQTIHGNRTGVVRLKNRSKPQTNMLTTDTTLLNFLLKTLNVAVGEQFFALSDCPGRRFSTD
ncbi:hypothetical protein CLF_111879 [Clonorchis sinensis]|uniref:Ig-like domain-containing protein n=1 Tax=Clonorchis sinensis TaxID=79923 RepID=H2KVC5_CLOSI|nr:hypothetical protein CLF_111879 [Clonorchis sinensis]